MCDTPGVSVIIPSFHQHQFKHRVSHDCQFFIPIGNLTISSEAHRRAGGLKSLPENERIFEAVTDDRFDTLRDVYDTRRLMGQGERVR